MSKRSHDGLKSPSKSNRNTASSSSPTLKKRSADPRTLTAYNPIAGASGGTPRHMRFLSPDSPPSAYSSSDCVKERNGTRYHSFLRSASMEYASNDSRDSGDKLLDLDVLAEAASLSGHHPLQPSEVDLSPPPSPLGNVNGKPARQIPQSAHSPISSPDHARPNDLLPLAPSWPPFKPPRNIGLSPNDQPAEKRMPLPRLHGKWRTVNTARKQALEEETAHRKDVFEVHPDHACIRCKDGGYRCFLPDWASGKLSSYACILCRTSGCSISKPYRRSVMGRNSDPEIGPPTPAPSLHQRSRSATFKQPSKAQVATVTSGTSPTAYVETHTVDPNMVEDDILVASSSSPAVLNAIGSPPKAASKQDLKLVEHFVLTLRSVLDTLYDWNHTTSESQQEGAQAIRQASLPIFLALERVPAYSRFIVDWAAHFEAEPLHGTATLMGDVDLTPNRIQDLRRSLPLPVGWQRITEEFVIALARYLSMLGADHPMSVKIGSRLEPP